jgi:hypothetical protein
MRASILLGAVAVATALAGCGSAGGEGGVPADVQFPTAQWKTDFSTHSVPLEEFASGGPGKDGIPAIDRPKFVSVASTDAFLSGREPVAVVELGGEAKAYPIQIMVWHEIVNDTLAGQPIALTYCPLCNSTVAFDREVDGRTLSFGTTGNLRNSDLVMYDRQTESWWQQITAEAVVGELTGAKLHVIPSQILSWDQFKRNHPDGLVLSRNTGYDRPYGRNPYQGYDQPRSVPFALGKEPDRTLPPKERVAAVKTGPRSALVYPFSRLEEEAPIDDTMPQRSVVGGRPIVVFYDPKVASPLDASEVSVGRDVGAAAVFDRRVRGRTLSFEDGARPGTFRDRETGSTWGMSGRATAGPLKGTELRQVPSDDQFWFALAAFFPHAEIRR